MNAAHVSPTMSARKCLKYEIPWHKLRGIRNHIVHVFDYKQIDDDIVAEVATSALPELEPKIRGALATIPLLEDFTLPEV